MKNGFSIRLALNNIRKHRRLFVPYMLAGAGLVAVFFIVTTLSMDQRLAQVRGGDYVRSFIGIGVFMTTLISVVLIFYTNSFLMKQRKREFGIYNILGMEKRHVNRIVFWENFISAVCSIAGGLLLGTLLYKICVLFICRVFRVNTILGFYFVQLENYMWPLLLFAGIYGVSFLTDIIQIACLKPVDLLKSSHAGEREPKIKWPLLVIGILSLAGGYYISIATTNPITAIALFFLAVFLVILATYCLFVSGSIALLKFLKKKKSFYYDKHHMVAVSGLLYRMKQNAVGLASIAIMATSVLVMVSSTFCLYAGTEDSLNKQYPFSVQVKAEFYSIDENGNRIYRPIEPEAIIKALEASASDCHVTITDATARNYLEVAYYLRGNIFETNQEIFRVEANPADIIDVTFVTAEEYEKNTGERIELKEGEVAVHKINSHAKNLPETVIIAGREYRIAYKTGAFPFPMTENIVSNVYGIVVPGEKELKEIFDNQLFAYANPTTTMGAVAFNFENPEDAETKDSEMRAAFLSRLDELRLNEEEQWKGSWDSRASTEEEYLGMNGTFLFLGGILTIVFLFATALVIYYKQISEGYDDRERFQIMQKVGMSNEEVKATIKSQVLLMFFLPLIVAGIHMIAAFPIIFRLLGVLFMTNLSLFVWCAIGAYLLFVIIYVVIYILTTKVYYHIVH